MSSFETLKKAYALGTKYLTNRGITISVGDLDVSKKVLEEKDKIIKSAEKKTEEIIESYNNKSLEIIPGKTREESRELKILADT